MDFKNFKAVIRKKKEGKRQREKISNKKKGS